MTNREDIQEKLRFLIKTTGAGLAPFDCWLVLRGMKTLGIRMERSQENAEQIAAWLQKQKAVTKVIYPGLPDHPGHEIMKKQARGFGAMLTIQLESKEFALAILEKVRMIRFAESLGGVRHSLRIRRRRHMPMCRRKSVSGTELRRARFASPSELKISRT